MSTTSGLIEPAVAATTDMLHVLSGPNAGAEAPLGDGAWLIGRDPESDLTFSEPALASRQMLLAIGAAGMTLEALETGASVNGKPVMLGTTVPLHPLDVVAVGTTAFAVGPPGSVWPSPRLDPPANITKATVAEVLAAVDPPTVEGRSMPAEVVPDAPAPMPLRRRRLRPMATGGAVILLAAAASFWLLRPAAPRAAAPMPADPFALARAAVHDMGLDNWVTVSGAGSRLVLSGQVRTAAQASQLTDALRRAGVDADVSVMADATVADMARVVLNSFGVAGQAAVTGPGQVTLTGFAADSGRLDLAKRRIHGDVPVVHVIDDRVDTPDRASSALAAVLRADGLGGMVQLGTTPAGITASGALGPAMMASWTKLAAAFRAEHGDRIRLLPSITTLASAEPRGVVLGRSAAVVLADGQRLSIGDTLPGTGRIVAISADHVRVLTSSGEVNLPYDRKPNWILEDNQ